MRNDSKIAHRRHTFFSMNLPFHGVRLCFLKVTVPRCAGLMGCSGQKVEDLGVPKPLGAQRRLPLSRGEHMALLTAAPVRGHSVGSKEFQLMLGEQA